MSCDFADRDGSYVLGALSPAERLEFEQHLAGCADCARSVRELAGLPGLLARVDPAVLDEPAPEEPLPETLLPALLQAVRRTRRRRTLVAAGVAAAALTAVVAIPLSLTRSDDGRTPSAAPPAAAGRAMATVGDAPVRATIALTPVAWGTRLDLACTYGEAGERYHHLPPSVTYGLFVRTRDGRTEEVGTWRSLEGRTMRLTAATAAPRQDIASVEVRTAKGRPVLELAG
jgi:Putative zinc-finger